MSETRRFARGGPLCAAFAKALKLDRPVRSIIIEADCSKPISVTVEFVASQDDADALRAIPELKDSLG